jgi:hypothetical protein
VNSATVYPALCAHTRRFFTGHRCYEYAFSHGPAGRTPADFRAVRVAPGPRTALTTYLSVGAWEGATPARVRFAPACRPRSSGRGRCTRLRSTWILTNIEELNDLMPVVQRVAGRSG